MKKKRILLLSSIVLFLAGVYVCNEAFKKEEFQDIPVVSVETKKETKEKMILPVKEYVNVERVFYDHTLNEKQQENALVYFEGVYRPSDGIDYTYDNKDFDVYAIFSGTVIRKEQDSLLGWIVSIEHQNHIISSYSSLSNVQVEKGDQVKQGDLIGGCGINVYQSKLKKHLHFMMSIKGENVNPLNYFNKSIDNIRV